MRLVGIFCSVIQAAAAGACANVRERFEMWRGRHRHRDCNSPPDTSYSRPLHSLWRLSMTFALLVSALKTAMDLTDGVGEEGGGGGGRGVLV